jgi:hypothetical protein
MKGVRWDETSVGISTGDVHGSSTMIDVTWKGMVQ